MTDQFEFLFTISSIIYNISGLIVIVASIIIFIKIRTLSTVLMLIGSILTLLLNGTNFIVSLLSNRIGYELYLKLVQITSVISSFTYLIFSMGIILFAIHDLKKLKRLS